jgi:hypothetical protein
MKLSDGGIRALRKRVIPVSKDNKTTGSEEEGTIIGCFSKDGMD